MIIFVIALSYIILILCIVAFCGYHKSKKIEAEFKKIKKIIGEYNDHDDYAWRRVDDTIFKRLEMLERNITRYPYNSGYTTTSKVGDMEREMETMQSQLDNVAEEVCDCSNRMDELENRIRKCEHAGK